MDKKKIVFAITGGIAIYKTLDVISRLRKTGKYEIYAIMTENATKLVSPLTFQTMTGNPVFTDTFSEDKNIPHISITKEAEIFIVIPATYNIIGKIACGIADDLVSTCAAAVKCRKIVAPAMNVNMYENPVLQNNLGKLKQNGWEIIDSSEGFLACGDTGKGRLADLQTIVDAINQPVEKILSGKKIIVTAGGTIEDIDPVRYISNNSSGKMGIETAKAAYDLGAEVLLVYGNVVIPVPKYLKSIKVRSAIDMLEVLKKQITNYDILIMASAVADFRVEKVSDEKIKKTDDKLSLVLVRNPDILKELSQFKEDKIFVGFAAESENLIENARQKLQNKKLDLICANNIKGQETAFHSETNKITLISEETIEELPRLSKYEAGRQILMQLY